MAENCGKNEIKTTDIIKILLLNLHHNFIITSYHLKRHYG